MEYRIVLTRMEFHALHGCYELERKVGNRFTVDLELTAELGHAATDDDVRKTVNYLTAYEVVEMQMRITQHTMSGWRRTSSRRFTPPSRRCGT